MLKQLAFASVITLLFACGQNNKKAPKSESYKTIDYVTVGKLMDSVKAPHVIDVSKGNKRIVFIGCDHNRDTNHVQFKIISDYFKKLKPEIAFNEGGQIAEGFQFPSYHDAILGDGETGALKYLSDKAGIQMLNGDVPDSTEFKITLKRHSAEDLLLYYLMERLVIPQLSGAYGNEPFEQLYNKAIEKWFVQQGFPLSPQQRSFAYFKALYKKKTGNNFQLKLTADIEKFDYINGGDCKFCAIGRTSKMVRDSVLLTKIDSALSKYNRVIVTFGNGHAIAVEPALKQIISRH